MPFLNRTLRVAALASLPVVCAYADVTLPALLSDHMVVQRGLPVHIWGKAAPAEAVSVAFRGVTRAATADEIGHWSIYLPPSDAGGPFELGVKGNNTVTLSDVMVGEVWVDSGQSNMEFALRTAMNAADEIAAADHPGIRQFRVNLLASPFPQTEAIGQAWSVCTPQSAGRFSAVAYFFARELEAKLGVAVGLIDSYWGGTPVEAWTRAAALGEDAAVAPLFASWGSMTERQADAELRAKNRQRMIDDAKAQGKPAPVFPWTPQLDSWGPGMLYNGMIAPLTPLPIRGAIWYQGESNSLLERAPLYSRIFRDMIEDWRRQWGVGDFPFLFVQISNFKSTPAEDWATLREQQLKTLALRNTAMAVTIDIGNPDNVHPTDKVDVGLRLARAARVLSYGEAIEDSGPIYRQATPEGSSIRAWFDHAKGLMAKGGELTGFEVAGVDGKFVAATATIDGETVLVASPSVAEPMFVRYGWANNPQCNLFNGEGLPASPFRSVE